MQTKAFDHFAGEWKRFIDARNLAGKKFDSEVELLCEAISVARGFIDEANSYTAALSKDENKCIGDLLFLMGRLLRLRDDPMNLNYRQASEWLSSCVVKSRKRNAPVYTTVTGGVERFFDAEPKVSPQDMENVIKEMYAVGKSFDGMTLDALGKFMAEIDSFAAENARVEVKVPQQKPFNKDTLLVLQEVLGVLHNSGDAESAREQSRVERFLKSSGVAVVWPEEDVVEETAEFFVIFKPGEKEARITKPYLKFVDMVFRGEKIMPA